MEKLETLAIYDASTVNKSSVISSTADPFPLLKEVKIKSLLGNKLDHNFVSENFRNLHSIQLKLTTPSFHTLDHVAMNNQWLTKIEVTFESGILPLESID